MSTIYSFVTKLGEVFFILIFQVIKKFPPDAPAEPKEDKTSNLKNVYFSILFNFYLVVMPKFIINFSFFNLFLIIFARSQVNFEWKYLSIVKIEQSMQYIIFIFQLITVIPYLQKKTPLLISGRSLECSDCILMSMEQ